MTLSSPLFANKKKNRFSAKFVYIILGNLNFQINLPEGRKNEGSVGHHHSDSVQILRDELILLKPLDRGWRIAGGQTL